MNKEQLQEQVRKSLSDLYKQQYGGRPYYISMDSVLEDMEDENYWKQFRISYSELNTKELLDMFRWARKDLAQLERHNSTERISEYVNRLSSIIIALKSELATREHVPNKKERDVIRKQKMIDKQNR